MRALCAAERRCRGALGDFAALASLSSFQDGSYRPSSSLWGLGLGFGFRVFWEFRVGVLWRFRLLFWCGGRGGRTSALLTEGSVRFHVCRRVGLVIP